MDAIDARPHGNVAGFARVRDLGHKRSTHEIWYVDTLSTFYMIQG
jgi:hypothetical protein